MKILYDLIKTEKKKSKSHVTLPLSGKGVAMMRLQVELQN